MTFSGLIASQAAQAMAMSFSNTSHYQEEYVQAIPVSLVGSNKVNRWSSCPFCGQPDDQNCDCRFKHRNPQSNPKI